VLRAEDKLKEANFFLKKLKTTKGKGEEFRYYLSALASATRSITLVLQADLRSEHGERFNEWWEQKKEDIPVVPISFETIRKLRNVLQKEGHKLRYAYKFKHNKEGVVIERLIDLFEVGSGPMEISFTDSPTISRNVDETIEDFKKRAIEELNQYAFSKILSAADSLTEFNVSSGVEVSTGVIYDFETLVAGFESYLASMQELIDEANLLFTKR
jgi:hypothetical protein